MAIFYNISPGRTKYAELVTAKPVYPTLQGEYDCDVAIIGGGATGLSAAYNLAKANIDTIVIDSASFGEGASGRNGGQIGSGHRIWPSSLEKLYGQNVTKALLDLWYEAKNYFLELLGEQSYNKGHISVIHKASLVDSYKRNIDEMAKYGYGSLSFLKKDALAEKLGSRSYKAGIYDNNTGHVNPLKFLLSLLALAQKSGVRLFENSVAINIEKKGNIFHIVTQNGLVKASKLLIATNGYNIAKITGLNGVLMELKNYIFPIYSYIAASQPLKEQLRILPNNESVDDSHFAVRYFRKEQDQSLIFGGAETYYGAPLEQIRTKIYQQIIAIYPQLKNIKLTHGWGGIVAITRQRMPYVKELAQNVTYCGGYSGHGLCLAPFLGKLYADSVTKTPELKSKFAIFKNLEQAPFLRGNYATIPALFLALSWHSLGSFFAIFGAPYKISIVLEL